LVATFETKHRSEWKRGMAKALRANATEAERKLWALLRGKKMARFRFRRQQPIGPYIVDFFCPAAKLVVELDGGQHGEDARVAYDAARTRWLENRGYRVLRFSNAEFLKDRNMALDGIARAIGHDPVPLPEPPSAVRPSLRGRVG
jgi:adenine-specific DNA-methyltransferase